MFLVCQFNICECCFPLICYYFDGFLRVEVTIFFKSLKRIKGHNVMYFESGGELAMIELVVPSWKRCQSLMQFRNSEDSFLKRLETLGKHGRKSNSRSNQENSIH